MGSITITEQTDGAGIESSPPTLSLRINFSWTFLGNVVYTAAQWGMVVVIAKLGLPEQVGLFTLGFAISAPIIIFSMLSLRQFQATDVKNEYSFRDYLNVRLITTLSAFVVLTFLVLVSKYPSNKAAVILLIGLAKSFEAISDICFGLFQKHERMDRVATSLILKAVLSIGFVSFAFIVTHSILWTSVSLALAWLIVLISYDLQNAGKILELYEFQGKPFDGLRRYCDFRKYKNLISCSLPLGFAATLITLNSNIPRYLIDYHLGEKALGIFVALVYLLYAGNTVIAALGQSASPRLARYYQTRDYRKYLALLLELVLIGTGLGLTGIFITLLFGKNLLTFVYGPEYAQNLDIFIWIMVGGCITYMCSFLGYGMTAARALKVQPFIYGVSAILCFLIGMWIIPHYGVLGAAWLLAFVASIQFLVIFFTISFSIYKKKSISPV